MRDAIILIFANKQDLTNGMYCSIYSILNLHLLNVIFIAMKPHEIQEKLGLTRIRDRNWYVQPSCATTGDGLHEGLAWLTSNFKQ